ncbi:MAG: hypothetical protein IPJ19_16375 [Planctomycetes bacterium]|nr:hypothetical protein [Planctomycetota bacterium]
MPFASRTAALCVLALLAFLVPCAGAQGEHVFHADKDLPGFEAAGFSEWSELYALDSYKEREGQELDAATLEELRARWKAESERVQARITAIQADPRERCAWTLERRLARNSYFSKIDYSILRPDPGCAMVLQRPAKDDPEYAKRLAGFYLPFVRRLEANFDELVAKPAGLARAEGRELVGFAVLASRGDLDNFLGRNRDAQGFTRESAYDYALDLAFTYEDPFVSVSVVGQRTNLLYQLARELEHAHMAIPGSRPGSIWLCEGLAILLSTHAGATAESLDGKTLRPESTECLMQVLDTEPDNQLLLLPADEWAGLRSATGYRNAVAARAKTRGVKEPARELVSRAFYAQCELWAHFLLEGEKGKYRKPFTEFLKLAFRGRGDAQDLRKAFVGTDVRALSREFVHYCCGEFERTHPGQRANGLGIDALFLDDTPYTETETPPELAASAAPIATASFAPAMLAPDEWDAEAQLALALADAREGDIERARQALEALAALAPAAPWPERIALEEQRLGELEKLRAGYLAFLQSSGTKLSLKFKGKPLLARVTGVEGDLVRLGDNRLGLPSVPLASVEPFEIAKVAAKPEQQGGAQAWARAYAYLVAGDARWEKMLKDDSPGAAALRASAAEYEGLLRSAALARELFELSKLPLPRDSKDAGARLERIRALLRSGQGTGLLVRRMDALRELARSSLAARAKDEGPLAGLHGQWSDLGGGRGKLVYEFDSQEEAQDWIKVPGYLGGDRKSYPMLARSEAQSNFAVSNGALRGVGGAVYRLATGFAGPVTLRYEFHYEDIKQAYPTPYFYWLLCDDGAGSFYASSPNGQMHVEDIKADQSRTINAADSQAFDFQVNWQIEFAFDGKLLKSGLQGAARTQLPASRLDRGSIGFVAHSDLPIVITRVEIEGALDPVALERLRGAWAVQELKQLGFP